MRRLSLLALLAAHSTLACASGAAPSTSGVDKARVGRAADRAPRARVGRRAGVASCRSPA